MNKLESLKLDIVRKYADIMNDNGPMHVFMKECATGYLHSFNIRALCSQYQLTGDSSLLEAATCWSDLCIRLQGSYGDPAAYNMGYCLEAPGNQPLSWFCADTLDQAYALLNTAAVLQPDHPLYIKILDSVLRYDQYIQQWNLGKDGFAVGFIDGANPNTEPYHTAGTRAICYYSGMYRIFNKDVYRQRGLDTLDYLLNKFDFNSSYHGSPLHNRCYAADALINAYYVLAVDEPVLRDKIRLEMNDKIIAWAIANQMPEGFWRHDRFGHQPGAAPESKEMGAYSWGMVMGLEIFNSHIQNSHETTAMLDRAYQWLEDNLVPGDVNRWGYHGWAALCITARYTPEVLFPFGDKIKD